MDAYEREELRAVCGDALRPGGLEITSEALDLCCFAPAARILDSGCGAGATLRLLIEKGFQAVGLDQSEVLLQEARQYGPVVQGDFHSLPWDKNHFDGIFCECVLILADDRNLAISECARVLKPGGRLVISDIFLQDEKLPAAFVSGCLGGALTLDELRASLTRAGFELEHVRDHTKALRELAARLVWHFGSRNVLNTLWAVNHNGSGCQVGIGAKFSYHLIICKKLKVINYD